MSPLIPASNINFTVSVPSGSTNHGNPQLLCTPPQWYDFVIFYFTNYFAPAATVINSPGQSWVDTLQTVVVALFLPFAGVSRALGTIMNHAVSFRDPIQRAARAEALCMVATTIKNSKYKSDREWWEVSTEDDFPVPRIDRYGMHIQGRYHLTSKYATFLKYYLRFELHCLSLGGVDNPFLLRLAKFIHRRRIECSNIIKLSNN
jgi:hypothetical protein